MAYSKTFWQRKIKRILPFVKILLFILFFQQLFLVKDPSVFSKYQSVTIKILPYTSCNGSMSGLFHSEPKAEESAHQVNYVTTDT